MRFLLIVLKIEEEAGGMTIETLNVLFIQISMVFIHVAEHWKDLDSTSAERSAPTWTKIRPVEFMRVSWVNIYDMCICLINAVLEK